MAYLLAAVAPVLFFSEVAAADMAFAFCEGDVLCCEGGVPPTLHAAYLFSSPVLVLCFEEFSHHCSRKAHPEATVSPWRDFFSISQASVRKHTGSNGIFTEDRLWPNFLGNTHFCRKLHNIANIRP